MTPRAVLAAATIALLLAGTFLPSPLYELYRRTWGISPAEISLVFAVYVVSLIPALLLFGGISDRIGRRPTLLLALALMAVALAIFAAARDLWWLIAGRAVQGLAMAVGSGTAAAAIRDWLAPAAQQRAGSVLVIAASLGSIAGALLGGILGEYGPQPLRVPYLVELALLVVLAALLLTMRVPASVRSSSYQGLPRIDPPIRRPFLIVASSSLLGWALFAIFSSLVPSFLAGTLGLHNLIVGGLVVTGLQVGSIIASTTRFPRRLANRIGLGCGAAGVLLLIAAVHARAPAIVAFSTLLTGAGGGLTYLTGLNVVATLARPERRAELASAFFVACYLGFSVPALAVGLAANQIGLYAAITIAAIVIAAASVVFLLLSTDRNLRVSEPPPR